MHINGMDMETFLYWGMTFRDYVTLACHILVIIWVIRHWKK